MSSNPKTPKLCFIFYCENCDYRTCKKSSYETHLFSDKHKKSMVSNKIMPQICPKLICDKCSKKYKNNSGLWKHKQKCNNGENQIQNQLDNPEKLITYLMKENSEFKQLLMDQNKQMMTQNDRIVELSKNVGNNNNNSFNLNLYLNETCKDALNIMDFVKQLKVGITELEETGRLGFADGISKIFINGLKDLDINNRPVHCSDSKRETLYIKDNNQWNKDDDDKTILTNAIKHVAHKNMKQISEWTKEHPKFNDNESKLNDKYLNIVSEAMPGSTQEETNKNFNKIIKNIVKETIINK